MAVSRERTSGNAVPIHNGPTTQYPSASGFVSNHWCGQRGQVNEKQMDLTQKSAPTAAEPRDSAFSEGLFLRHPLASRPGSVLCHRRQERATRQPHCPDGRT